MLALILVGLIPCFALAGNRLDIVDLGYAKYLGNRTYDNTVAYLGIPYAQPPIGNLRFRAPLPLNTGVEGPGRIVDARAYPENCFQAPGIPGGTEDCLKLNVYAPVGAKEGDNLPVLFYIHGGGYLFGDPNTWPFDHWVHQSPNIIIVSVYYRLSAFGFLSSPAFADSKEADFNPGLLDQLLALDWVNKWIHKFGGRPRNGITIMGQSAGGSSVELVLVARPGRHRGFGAAIAQSVYRIPVPRVEQTEAQFQAFIKAANCSAAADISGVMACLRKAETSTISKAQDEVGGFRPVVDGTLITDAPTKLILEGKYARVPLIIGATTNETLAHGSSIPDALTTFFGLDYTVQDAEELSKAYDGAPFPADGDLRTQTITGDASVRCSRTILGSAFPKSWTYRFDQPSPLSANPQLVTHSADNYFLFNGSDGAINGKTTFYPLTAPEKSFAEGIISYLVSFVRTSGKDPNRYKSDDVPIWSQYDARGRERMVFRVGSFNMEREPKWEVKGCLDGNAVQVIKGVQQN